MSGETQNDAKDPLISRENVESGTRGIDRVLREICPYLVRKDFGMPGSSDLYNVMPLLIDNTYSRPQDTNSNNTNSPGRLLDPAYHKVLYRHKINSGVNTINPSGTVDIYVLPHDYNYFFTSYYDELQNEGIDGLMQPQVIQRDTNDVGSTGFVKITVGARDVVRIVPHLAAWDAESHTQGYPILEKFEPSISILKQACIGEKQSKTILLGESRPLADGEIFHRMNSVVAQVIQGAVQNDLATVEEGPLIRSFSGTRQYVKVKWEPQTFERVIRDAREFCMSNNIDPDTLYLTALCDREVAQVIEQNFVPYT